MVVSFLIFLVAIPWWKQSPQVAVVPFCVTVGLVWSAFMVLNWLRKKRLISRMKRLQDHVKFIRPVRARI
jgi:hypothetical protein